MRTRYVLPRGGSLRVRVGREILKFKLQELNGAANLELLEALPPGISVEVLMPRRSRLRRRNSSRNIHRILVDR